ncbi:MAG: hypothetical protein WCO52_04840 [bacterium]
MLALFLMANVAQSQQIDPSFPLLGKTYGPAGIYIPDAVGISNTSLNPARQMSITDISANNQVVEGDFGRLSLANSNADWEIGNYSFVSKDRRAVGRISWNHFTVGHGIIPATDPAEIAMRGDAWELIGAYRVNKHLDVGGAIVPEDATHSSLQLQGQTLASGGSRSQRQGRVGAYYHAGKLGLGYEAGWERGVVSSSILGNAPVSSGYNQDHTTYGASWSPKLGTTAFYNRQRFNLKNEALGLVTKTDYWGVQQALSRKVIAQIARSDKATALSATWLPDDRYGLNVSYTNRAFSTSEAAYGKGNLTFVSLWKSF